MRLVLLLSVLLCGCVRSVPMYGSDGIEYTHISCSGGIDSMTDCYRKANEVCPRGYFLADRQYSATPASIFTLNSDRVGTQAGAVGMANEDRAIVVKCK